MRKPAPRRFWLLRPGQTVREVIASEYTAAFLVFGCCLYNVGAECHAFYQLIQPFPSSY